MVPGPGLEPGRPRGQGILSPPCLPIPPPRRSDGRLRPDDGVWQGSPKLIVVNLDAVSSQPVVKGGAAGLDFILGLSASGWTVKQVLENHPALSPETLRPSRRRD